MAVVKPHVAPHDIVLFGGAIVQFTMLLRWLYRRIRNDEIQRAFVEDIANNHLPHIYEALRHLCAERGIVLRESPPIRWTGQRTYRH
jgi:hypothetical protein